MPLWRCPHCGTPQAEASRCWVCRRSTTCCATCREFRRGVASGLGLCGLDARRSALRGTEVRPCWTAPDAVVEPVLGSSPATPGSGRAGRPDERPHRTFVPIEEVSRVPVGPGPVTANGVSAVGADDRPGDAVPFGAPMPATSAPRWSLWGEAEV